MTTSPLNSATRRHTAATLTALSLTLLALAALRLCIGEDFGWPPGSLIGATQRMYLFGWLDHTGFASLMDIRLNRLVLALLVGVSLSTSGVALQALLRNPLAEPFLLGLSSGAGVGVTAQMVASYYLNRPFGAHHIGALVGATVSMLIVYTAGRRHGLIDPVGLLLIGVVLSTINGAIIVLLNYIPGSAGLRDDLARWMMGYLNETVMGSPTVLIVTLATAAGLAVLLCHSRAMDAASFSDEEAQSLGVNLRRLRAVLFVTASALAAGAVVLSGPIAFVGLICPHLARLLLGPGHSTLLIGSALIGAMLVLLSDTATVCLDFGQGRLPLGIFTAVLGGPVFVWILRPHLGRGIQ